jgi:hypothetical protein
LLSYLGELKRKKFLKQTGSNHSSRGGSKMGMAYAKEIEFQNNLKVDEERIIRLK